MKKAGLWLDLCIYVYSFSRLFIQSDLKMRNIRLRNKVEPTVHFRQQRYNVVWLLMHWTFYPPSNALIFSPTELRLFTSFAYSRQTVSLCISSGGFSVTSRWQQITLYELVMNHYFNRFVQKHWFILELNKWLYIVYCSYICESLNYSLSWFV